MWITELEGRSLTIGITLTCGVAFMLFGVDQGVFGGILGNAQFIKTFNNPTTTIQGQIVSTYGIGCILGALMTILIDDTLGRKKTIMLVCLFVIIGGALQASSFSLPQTIIARLIAGLGIGMESAATPAWQSETCKPKHRGKLVALQLVLVIGGITMTEFINLGFSYIVDKPVSWRFPLSLQCVFAFLAIFLVACMPESPRWLCLKERNDEPQVVIARLMAKPVDSDEVVESLQLIISTVCHEKELEKVGWGEIFSNGEQQTFRRICLGARCSPFRWVV